MKPRLCRGSFAVLVLCVGGGWATSSSHLQENENQPRYTDELSYAVGPRTFLFGKLVLVPVLAAVGLKFLALLPIVLTKIALLSLMNFLSTNLNLIISTVFGLRNFLGKHGLWAQDETTKHPELDAIAEWSSQPVLQPTFRYQYVVDREPVITNFETTKSPDVLKVFNGYVSATESNVHDWAFDRKTRANDNSHLLRSTDQKINDTPGKYKCYWTNDAPESRTQYEIGTEYGYNRRKFNTANTMRTKMNVYNSRDLRAYRDYPLHANNNGNVHDNGQVYRQVATHRSAEKINDDSGGRDQDGDYGQLPFTDGQVKVHENYQDEASSQQPIVYLMSNLETTTAKFKDDVER